MHGKPIAGHYTPLHFIHQEPGLNARYRPYPVALPAHQIIVVNS